MTERCEFELNQMARIERITRDVFEKRFNGRVLQYETARDLVWLEKELVEEIGSWLLSRPEPGPEPERVVDIVWDQGVRVGEIKSEPYFDPKGARTSAGVDPTTVVGRKLG